MEKKSYRNKSRQKSDFYTRVAPVYDLLAGPFLRPARRRIVRAAETARCRRILDVACGTADQAVMLAQAGFEVSGLDLSPAMLRVARDKSFQEVTLFQGNARSLPFGPGSFDCVTISLALHEMAKKIRMEAAGEMLRVLKPGGKLIVLDYASSWNWSSAAGLAILGFAETIAGREHFGNFARFTRMGGIDRFLEAFRLKVTLGGTYFLGALRVVLSEKTSTP